MSAGFLLPVAFRIAIAISSRRPPRLAAWIADPGSYRLNSLDEGDLRIGSGSGSRHLGLTRSPTSGSRKGYEVDPLEGAAKALSPLPGGQWGGSDGPTKANGPVRRDSC